MIGLWKFSSKCGGGKGLLAIYILHTIKKGPKSGYDINREFREKTDGKWVPSKGTLYPLLKQLGNEELIRVKSVGERSKNIFEITEKGEEVLSNVQKQKEESRNKFKHFRKLFAEIFIGEEKSDIFDMIFQIKELSFELSLKKKSEVGDILARCLSDLKGLD